MATNKSFPIQIQPANGMDMDSDPSQVANGDWTYALNARTHSSNKYSVKFDDVTSFPYNTGDKRSIKPYFGEDLIPVTWENNQGETINPATYISGANLLTDFDTIGFCEGTGIRNRGYFFILRLDDTVDEPKIVIVYHKQGINTLLRSYEVVTGDDLEPYRNWTITSLAQIDDYLYFLDLYGEPLKFYVGLNAAFYNKPLEKLLIKTKPLGAPEIIDVNDIYYQGSPILGQEGNTPNGVQFAYTYKHNDNTETPLSYFSQVFPIFLDIQYQLKHSTFDDSTPAGSNLLNRGIKSLQFYFRQSDVGLWKLIDTFVLNGTTNVIVLYNAQSDGGITLPTNKQNKYFESIPITSKALETINGRIFLGNNRLSYNSPIVPNADAFDIGIGGTYSSITASALASQKKLKSLKAGGNYNIGVYGVDVYGRVTGITKLDSVKVPRKNILLDQSIYTEIEKAYNFQNVIGAGISNACEFPAGTVYYGFAKTKCLNISLFLTGIAKWQYYYIPNSTSGVNNPYAGYALADAYAPLLSPPKPAPTGIAIILNSGEGYNWQLGDRLYVNVGYYSTASGATIEFPDETRYDYEIIAAFGNVLMLDQASAQNWYLRIKGAYDIQHVSYEIYRPKTDTESSNIYYAASPLQLIQNLTDDPAANSVTIEGDVMLVPYGYTAIMKNKIIFNQGYQYVAIANLDVATDENFLLETRYTSKLPLLLFKECTNWSVNFPFDQTWNNRTLGWINEPLTLNSNVPIDSPTHICFSDVKIAATEVDGTGNFDALNYAIYPQEYGVITKLVRVSDNQLESVGALLMALFQRETVSIYVSRITLQQISGVAQVLLSDKVLGSFNAQLGSCGCINPESVVRQDGRIYFWDGTKNRVIRYSRDGLTAISQFGMSTHFGFMKANGILKVYGGYDYNNNELYLTFKTDPQLTAPTYVWNEDVNRWVTLHTILPEFYGTNGEYEDFTFFKRGNAKAFTSVANPSKFNGTYTTPIIDFVVNPELRLRKLFKAIRFYKGFTAPEGDVDFQAFFSKSFDYFSNKIQITDLSDKPQSDYDGKEILSYSAKPIDQNDIRDYDNTDPIAKGNFPMFFLYGILRVSLGATKRGIYLIDVQYQSNDDLIEQQ